MVKNKMLIIGDVHGKLKKYKNLIKQTEYSVCVGDFGFYKIHRKILRSTNFDKEKHKVILGNHDFRSDEGKFPHVLDKFGEYQLETTKFFYISGAESIDVKGRMPGVSWFYNEELSYMEFQNCIDMFYITKPLIVISHDCPQLVVKHLSKSSNGGCESMPYSRTRKALEVMFEIHQPKLWVFGHHHVSFNKKINGTRFICLKELETMTL